MNKNTKKFNDILDVIKICYIAHTDLMEIAFHQNTYKILNMMIVSTLIFNDISSKSLTNKEFW